MSTVVQDDRSKERESVMRVHLGTHRSNQKDVRNKGSDTVDGYTRRTIEGMTVLYKGPSRDN